MTSVGQIMCWGVRGQIMCWVVTEENIGTEERGINRER